MHDKSVRMACVKKIRNFIFIMVALIGVGSCASIEEVEMDEEMDNQNEEIDVNENDDKTLITFLALGDSYTIGQGVPENLRWPNQLKTELLKSDKNISDIDFIAQTGWTTSDLLLAIEGEKPETHDLVSLLIGVNNQYQGIPFYVFETEFDSLLNIAIDLAGNNQRVFVVSIPDYGVTPFASSFSEQITEEINTYNHYIEDRCKFLGIPFIDVTGISRELGDSNNALANDGLHPSGFQYGKWVEEIIPVVVELLD